MKYLDGELKVEHSISEFQSQLCWLEYMLLITYHTWYTWKKIMFKTVSVFHKLTLKLPYNPIIFKNRIFFTISDFVDIILIFFRIQRTIWWWFFFGSLINFLHFCTIFKTQYLIKYSKYTEKNFTIVFVFSIWKQWV